MIRTYYSLTLFCWGFVSLFACNSNPTSRTPSQESKPKPANSSTSSQKGLSKSNTSNQVPVEQRRKTHLRTANPAELKKIRRAGAVLRARVFQQQNSVEFPAGFPDVVRRLFVGPEHGKLIGLEVFKGMSRLKRKSTYRFARIRYMTLASRTALNERLGTLFKSAGWTTSPLPEKQRLQHAAIGEVEWLIQETVDQPTIVDIRAKLTPKSFGNLPVKTLLRRPPSWWSGLNEADVVAFEYSRFHLRKTGAAFTDVERMTAATIPGSVDTFKDALYAYAKGRQFAFQQNKNILVGPNKETLVIQPGPGGLALVHHQNRWIAPTGKGPFRE